MRSLLSVPLRKILQMLSTSTGTLQTAPLILENWSFAIITTLKNKILLLIITFSNLFKDSVKALHTCSRFFKYLKTYAFYPHKGIYFLKGNKILYKIVVLRFTFK